MSMKRWLFILLFFPVATYGQFRMVSSTVTLVSTVNDSTYIVDVDFFSDQTAKGYYATGITTSYRLFSQTGQLYSIDSTADLTLSSATLKITEIDNNYVDTELAPVGQVLVYNPQGDYVTYTPFGNNNMGQVLQQAVGTYNAIVSAEGGSIPTWSSSSTYEPLQQVAQAGKIYTNKTGANTSTPPSGDPTNWEVTNKTEILNDIDGRDTISQASHGFSLGDPLWYSGDYILAQDTGTSVRVDGIVVEVIDANTFVRQRSGKFILSSHGFTANIQLYVQDDGSYDIASGDNALVYGYAVSANEIEIGAKPDQIRNIANKYPDLFAGRGVQTTIEMLDSLAGFQSFGDLTSILSADPAVGVVLEDRSTGFRYKVVSDSIIGIPIDNVYQQSLGGGKYIIIENEGSISLSDENLTTTSMSSVLTHTKKTIIDATITDTTTQDYIISLPSLVSVPTDREIVLLANIESDTNSYYIECFDSDLMQIENSSRFVSRYSLSNGDNVLLKKIGDYWRLKIIESQFKKKYFSDFPSRTTEGDFIEYNGLRYRTLKSLPSGITEDGAIVKRLKDAAYTGENLFKGSEDVHHGSLSTNEFLMVGAIKQSPISDIINKVIAPNGDYTADLVVSTGAGLKTIEKYVDQPNQSIQLDSGDVVTLSFWIKLLPGNNNNDIYLSDITLRERRGSPFAANNLSATTYSYYPDTLNKNWERVSFSWVVENDMSGVPYFPGVLMTYNADGVDTMSIWGVQFERTSVSSEYKYTGENTNDWFVSNPYLYSLLEPKNGILDLNGAYRSGLVSDGDFIQTAIDYCEALDDCSTIKIPDGLTSNREITLPSYMGLIGDGRYLTTLNFDLSDSTKSGIIFEKDGVYTIGQTIKDIQFDALSNMYAIIEEGPTFSNNIERVIANGNNFSKYGFLIGKTGESGAIASNHWQCFANNNTEYGFYFENSGSLHTINQSNIARNKIGVGGNSFGLLQINDTQIEENDSLQLYFTGGTEATLSGVYIENGTLSFSNMYTVMIKDSRISGGEVFFDSVVEAVVQKNRIFNKVIFKKDTQSGLTIRNNWYENYRDLLTQRGAYARSAKFTMHNNYSPNDPANFIPKNTWSRNKDYQSEITSGLLRNNVITGLSRINNLTWAGVSENLLPYSDSLAVEATTAYFQIQNNVVENPINGDVDADILIGLDSLVGSSGLGSRTMPVTVDIGDTITYSFWAKSISEYPSTEFLVSLNGGNKWTIGKIYSSNWERYEVSFISTVSSNTLVFDVRQVLQGDTVAVYGRQVNRGIYALDYVDTGASGTYNTDVEITILDPDNTAKITGGLDVQGNITNVDSLKWQMYTVTTASTVTLNYPNNIISSTLNNGTFILDPSGFTGDNMIVKVNSFATDNVTLDASGSYNFTINGVTQSTYDLLGDGAYAEFSFNSSLGTFELQNSSNDNISVAHYFPSNGDTLLLSHLHNTVFLGTDDSIYVDESGLIKDAFLTIIQSSGKSTILKADGVSNRFYQAGQNRSQANVYGTGSVKTFQYNKSTNHWYIENDHMEDVTLFTDYSTYQATVTPYPNEMIRYDALTSAGTTTISTDNLLQYQKFYLEIVNADTNPVTLDHATGGFIRGSANGDFGPDATETFSGSYHSLILIWDGTNFTIKE